MRIIMLRYDDSHVYICEIHFIVTTLGISERARLFDVMMPLDSK